MMYLDYIKINNKELLSLLINSLVNKNLSIEEINKLQVEQMFNLLSEEDESDIHEDEVIVLLKGRFKVPVKIFPRQT